MWLVHKLCHHFLHNHATSMFTLFGAHYNWWIKKHWNTWNCGLHHQISCHCWATQNRGRHKQGSSLICKAPAERRRQTNKRDSAQGRGEVFTQKSSGAVSNTISDSSSQPVTQGRDWGTERKGGRKRGGERWEEQKLCCRTHLFSILAGGRKAEREEERRVRQQRGGGRSSRSQFSSSALVTVRRQRAGREGGDISGMLRAPRVCNNAEAELTGEQHRHTWRHRGGARGWWGGRGRRRGRRRQREMQPLQRRPGKRPGTMWRTFTRCRAALISWVRDVRSKCVCVRVCMCHTWTCS